MSPRGPNLSHWPGNRTPDHWKADLSTGICLNFARAPHSAQLEFLEGAQTVLNDHYDTDGFLSLLAALRPDVILPRETTALDAAATGDYQAFQTDQGFAIDRIVLNLATPTSPIAGGSGGNEGSGPSRPCRSRCIVSRIPLRLNRTVRLSHGGFIGSGLHPSSTPRFGDARWRSAATRPGSAAS